MMHLTLNGRSLQTPSTTLQALLQEQGFDFQAAFACAINQRFIPRPKWAEQVLQEGDKIDAVSPVTGG
jgi:sulfur carrier protein